MEKATERKGEGERGTETGVRERPRVPPERRPSPAWRPPAPEGSPAPSARAPRGLPAS